MTNANITRTEAVANENTAKNVELFLAAPVIGLDYAVLLPFVGIAMLRVTGTKPQAGCLGRCLMWAAARAVAEPARTTR